MNKRDRYKEAHQYIFYKCIFYFENKDSCIKALYGLFYSTIPVAFIQKNSKALVYIRNNTQLKAVTNVLNKHNIKYTCKIV